MINNSISQYDSIYRYIDIDIDIDINIDIDIPISERSQEDLYDNLQIIDVFLLGIYQFRNEFVSLGLHLQHLFVGMSAYPSLGYCLQSDDALEGRLGEGCGLFVCYPILYG